MSQPTFEEIDLTRQSLQQSAFNPANPIVIVANGFLRWDMQMLIKDNWINYLLIIVCYSNGSHAAEGLTVSVSSRK